LLLRPGELVREQEPPEKVQPEARAGKLRLEADQLSERWRVRSLRALEIEHQLRYSRGGQVADLYEEGHPIVGGDFAENGGDPLHHAR